MARKKKRKHVFKGVRYIANTLKKYFKGKYGSYAEALPRAREIHADLIKRGEKVGVKAIFPMERKKREPKEKPGDVIFVPELLVPTNFFNLGDYPSMIAFCSKNVFFESKLYSDSLPEIQGGDVVDYQEYFAPFVSFINSMMALEGDGGTSYETDWWVRCTPPIKVGKDRYVSKIISCDGSGDPFDYGFDPESDTRPDEVIVSEPSEKPTKPSTEPISGKTKEDIAVLQAETEKIKAETEKARQENIKSILKLFDQGIISKQELKEFFSKMK